MKNKNQKYYGLFAKLLTDPSVYLMAKNAGLDFMFYDLEHGIISMEKIHDLVLFGNNIQMPTFIRVAELTRKEIFNALDCGATGIMVPMIESKEQSEKLVEYSKYPPIGNRGYSSGANTNYGPSGSHDKNINDINDRTVTIAQIETKLGVENAEEIIKTPGIDAIIVGPVDLSISLGNIGNIMHENELKAIDHVIELCHKYNKSFGIIGSNTILEHYNSDINYYVSAIDVNLVRDSLIKSKELYDKITGGRDE